MLTGIVILAIGVLLAWGVSDLWSNTMTDEEAANSLLVRDDLFGNLIGASDYIGLPAFVAPDAELTVPGGTLSGPVGMRTLVQEMNRCRDGWLVVVARRGRAGRLRPGHLDHRSTAIVDAARNRARVGSRRARQRPDADQIRRSSDRRAEHDDLTELAKCDNGYLSNFI